jgi:hypothetical protein
MKTYQLTSTANRHACDNGDHRRNRPGHDGSDCEGARRIGGRCGSRLSRCAAAFDEGPGSDATAGPRPRPFAAQIVRDRADELAEIETRNSGKPIVESEFDIADVATCFEYWRPRDEDPGDVLPVPDNAMSWPCASRSASLDRSYRGTIPLMAAWKLRRDLRRLHDRTQAAEQTPMTVLELASSFAEAGLPPGVVNVVSGMAKPAPRWSRMRTSTRSRHRQPGSRTAHHEGRQAR